MAIIVFDGFDHYNSPGSDMLSRTGALVWTACSGFNGFVTGRNGYGMALSFHGSAALTGSLAANYATFFLGFGLNFTADSLTYRWIFSDSTTSTAQYYVTFNNNNGQISVYRSAGNVLLGTSATNSYALNAYNYIEIGGTISTSAGSVTVRVNGVAVIALTAVDNQSSSNAFVNQIAYSGPNGAYTYLDDLYFADNTSGPGPYPFNTFLGDVSVDTVFPTSNGAVAWTPLTGANWQEVSETAMDSDTSYNYSSTAGLTDLFNVGAVRAATTQILAVQLTGAYRKDDASAHVVAQKISSSSSVGTGANNSVPSSYVYCTDLFVLDPHVSAPWTVASIGAAQIGYNMVS